MQFSESISTLVKYKGGDLWSIGPDATVYDAIKLMADKDISALLVIEDKNLVGLLSEREYTRDVILKERSPKITAVRDIMKVRVPRVEPKDTVVHAMELMTRKRVRHLPVLKRGEIIGIAELSRRSPELHRGPRALDHPVSGWPHRAT